MRSERDRCRFEAQSGASAGLKKQERNRLSHRFGCGQRARLECIGHPAIVIDRVAIDGLGAEYVLERASAPRNGNLAEVGRASLLRDSTDTYVIARLRSLS
jgi:hypothetical protein